MQPLVLALLLFSVTAFSPVSSADILRVRLSAPPQTLDWNSATSGSESAILQNIMEGLFGFDSKLNPVPMLASRYRWLNDQKTLEITLRDSVKWSDGTALKAIHFADSFEHLLNPSVNSPNASLLFDVKGARDYFFGKSHHFSNVGIEASKPNEKAQWIRITLNEPRANFIHILTHWATYPMRREKPASTLGPYRLVLQEANALTLKVNPNYHGKKPAIQEVVFRVLPDAAAALKEYQAHKIDYLLQVEDQLLESPVNQNLAGLGYVDPIRVVALLHFNPNRVNTNTAEKRRAIMAAIPIEALIGANKKTQAMAPSIIPRGMLGGPDASTNAKLIVQKTNAKIPEEALTLGYPNDAYSKNLATELQNAIHAQSKKLKIKIEVLPGADPTATKRYDLILTLFGLDYFDPDQLLSSFLSQGTHDLFNLSSAELLGLIQKARATQNTKERAAFYAAAADFLENKIAVVMPLFYRRRAYLLSPQFKEIEGSRGSPLITHLRTK